MADRIQLRIDTHDRWESLNTELAQGEPIVAVFPVTPEEAALGVKATFRMKVGTGEVGKTRYNDLDFLQDQSGIRGRDGKNAYDTCVAAGLFTGTVEEWYNSLKGGPSGPEGPKGDDGDTPIIGLNNHWYIGGNDTGISAIGEKGDPGDPIAINYYYSSVSDMLASAVPVGSFIMIANSDVADPDNGKIFYKLTSEFKYLYKFSDMTTIKGPKGDPGPVGPPSLIRKYNDSIQISTNNGQSWTTLVTLEELKPTPAEQLVVSPDEFNAIERRANGIYVQFPSLPTVDEDDNPITSIVKFYLSNLNNTWESNFTYPTQQHENGAFMPARAGMLTAPIVKRVNFPDGLVAASDNMYIQISLNQSDWFSIPITITGTTIGAFDGNYGIGIEAVDSRSINLVLGRGATSIKPWDFNFWWRICIEKFLNVIVQYPSKGVLTELNDVDITVGQEGILSRNKLGIVKTQSGMLVPNIPEGLVGSAEPVLKAIDGHLTWDANAPDVYYNNIEGIVPYGSIISAPTLNGRAHYLAVDHYQNPKIVKAYSNYKRSNGYVISNWNNNHFYYTLFDETCSLCMPIVNNDIIGYYFITPATIGQITFQFYDQLSFDPWALPTKFTIEYTTDGFEWIINSVFVFPEKAYKVVLTLPQELTNIRAIRVLFNNFTTIRYNTAYIKNMKIGRIKDANSQYRGLLQLTSQLNTIQNPIEDDFADIAETNSEWKYQMGPNPIYIGSFEDETMFPLTGIGDGYRADNEADGKEWYFDQNLSNWTATLDPIGTTPHRLLGWFDTNLPIETTSHGTFESAVEQPGPLSCLPNWNYIQAPLIINYNAGKDDGGQRSIIKNYENQILEGPIISNLTTQYVYAKYNPHTDLTQLICLENIISELDTGERVYNAGNIATSANTVASVGYHKNYKPQNAFNNNLGDGEGDCWISANTAQSSSYQDPCKDAWIGQKNLIGKVYQIRFYNKETNKCPNNIAVDISADGIIWSTLRYFSNPNQAGHVWNDINLPEYGWDENQPHWMRIRALDSGPNNVAWMINEIYFNARRTHPADKIIYNTRTQEYYDGYGNRHYLQLLGRITILGQFSNRVGKTSSYIVDSSSENNAQTLAVYDTAARWRTNQKNTKAYFGLKDCTKPISRIQWYTFNEVNYCVNQVTVEIQRENNVSGTWEEVQTFTVSKTINTMIDIRPNYICDTTHAIRVRSSGANIDWIVFFAEFYESTNIHGTDTSNIIYNLDGQQCLSDYMETDWFAVGKSGTYTFFNELGSSDIDIELYWKSTNAPGFENSCTVIGHRTYDGAGVRVTTSNIYVYTGSEYTYISRYTNSGGGYYKLIAKRRKNIKTMPS